MTPKSIIGNQCLQTCHSILPMGVRAGAADRKRLALETMLCIAESDIISARWHNVRTQCFCGTVKLPWNVLWRCMPLDSFVYMSIIIILFAAGTMHFVLANVIKMCSYVFLCIKEICCK